MSSLLFARVDRALRRLPDVVLMAIGVAIMLGLATVHVSDALHDVPIDDFYLVPVAAIAWLARSRAWGYAAAVIAVVTTVVTAHAGATQAPLGPTLVSAAVRLAFYLVVVMLIGQVRRLVELHAEEARVDELTGVANTRAFREAAGREIARLDRYGRPLSTLYLDVDDFKQVNDSFGHTAGDALLQRIGHVLVSCVRGADFVARIGGDEFVALMPETDGPAAARVARRIREDLARVQLPDGSTVHCSMGVATVAARPDSVDALIHAADELMYRAKQRGKDRIETSGAAA